MMIHFQHQDDHIVIGSVKYDEEAMASLLDKFSENGVVPALHYLVHEGDQHLLMVHHKAFEDFKSNPVACLEKVKEVIGEEFAGGFTVDTVQP
ncbi:hypothetical protein D3C76_112810 [compost metagenome]